MYLNAYYGLFCILFILKIRNIICEDIGTFKLGTSAVIYCKVI